MGIGTREAGILTNLRQIADSFFPIPISRFPIHPSRFTISNPDPGQPGNFQPPPRTMALRSLVPLEPPEGRCNWRLSDWLAADAAAMIAGSASAKKHDDGVPFHPRLQFLEEPVRLGSRVGFPRMSHGRSFALRNPLCAAYGTSIAFSRPVPLLICINT